MSKQKKFGKPGEKVKKLSLRRETIKDLVIKPSKGGAIQGGRGTVSLAASGSGGGTAST